MTPEQMKAIDSVSKCLKNLAEHKEILTAFKGVASKESGYKEKKHYYGINGEWVEVEQAIKTDPRAFNTVMLKIAEYVEADKPLPPFYKKIALQILKQEIKTPANKSHRLQRSEQYRGAVVTAVAALKLIGITPTTSKIDVEAIKKTGCSMVAEFITGLNNTDIGLVESDYQAIESIWKRREKDPATKGRAENLFEVAYWAGYRIPDRKEMISGGGQSLEDFISKLKPVGNK